MKPSSAFLAFHVRGQPSGLNVSKETATTEQITKHHLENFHFPIDKASEMSSLCLSPQGTMGLRECEDQADDPNFSETQDESIALISTRKFREEIKFAMNIIFDHNELTVNKYINRCRCFSEGNFINNFYRI